jgi:hypothetical protein
MSVRPNPHGAAMLPGQKPKKLGHLPPPAFTKPYAERLNLIGM